MVDENGVDIPGADLQGSGVLYDFCVGSTRVGKNLDHLAALVVIKMRIVAHLELQRYFMVKENAAAETTSIRAKIATQKRLLDKYLHMTHRENKYILHILGGSQEIANKMWAQGRPQSYSRNSPQEAFFVMERIMRHIARVPLLGISYCATFLQEMGETSTPNLNYDSR